MRDLSVPGFVAVPYSSQLGVNSMKTNQLRATTGEATRNMEGRVLPPLILWMLGVPGIVVIGLWFFFFRG